MNSLFNYTHNIDGKIGIGTIPVELHSFLDNIYYNFIHFIPINSTTFHTYYNHLNFDLQHNFDIILFHHFWDNICLTHCIKYCVNAMNEIYFSNPKPNFEKTNLYGAAANLIPHRDCILFNFYGINLYRIIIGITDNNNDTYTEFINFNLEHTINKGDYMIFDFDKTLHQVKKFGQQETPRLLLKIHFIVCENCKYSDNYVKFISNFYISYYLIARYTEQIGTDPETFMGFFFGLIWEWGFYSSFKYITTFLLFSIFFINLKYKINLQFKDIAFILFYSFFSLFILYLWIVTFFYFRFILFNIK